MRLTALWWWIDRWRKSTAYTDMTLEEQGAYRNLLDDAALRGGPLPNDEGVLAKACGDPRRWRRVRAKVMKHFTLAADGWRNETLDEVLRESERRAKNQANYRKRAGHKVDNERDNDHDNKPASPSPSPSPIVVPAELHDRARAAPPPRNTPIIGRNAHLAHALCDDTHSYCVPAAVHHKLASLLAPKYAGDHDAAADALLAWYPTVWAGLAAGFVMGEAFRFWQSRFDAAFASATPTAAPSMFKPATAEDIDAQREILRAKAKR